MVWSVSGAQRGGSVERGSVQCDGGLQRAADSPLCCQHPQLTVGADPGTGLLPQQGLYMVLYCYLCNTYKFQAWKVRMFLNEGTDA